MTLKNRINDDMKSAMRARDAARLSAIRMLLAAIKQCEIDERKELSDTEVVGVVERMLKQRKESIAHYKQGGREDLVQAEQLELTVLQAYMPEALSDAEVEAAVAAAIESSGARAIGDMGKVMGELKSRLAGRADMSRVSALVRARLSG
ncbi:MAG TPA: GatB/YqeY domain-containing protein [Burkholderiales bacterium]|nr:GatB/YqeY domain-containing protein [Burkholderiales bacterium]